MRSILMNINIISKYTPQCEFRPTNQITYQTSKLLESKIHSFWDEGIALLL